jgi:hypothetical protein
MESGEGSKAFVRGQIAACGIGFLELRTVVFLLFCVHRFNIIKFGFQMSVWDFESVCALFETRISGRNAQVTLRASVKLGCMKDKPPLLSLFLR